MPWPDDGSLDHLVGAGDERRRQGEAERMRGLEIDEQLETRGQFERQVRGPRAAQDAGDQPAAVSPIALCFGPYDIRPPPRTITPVSKIVGSRFVFANSRTRLRLRRVSASDTMRMASGRSRVISAKACSKSSGSRTPKVWTLTPSTRAASSAER